MKITRQIINSLLDQDVYTFYVGQMAFCEFPDCYVEYKFINRGKTVFPEGFVDELKNQLEMMENIQLTLDERDWMSLNNCFTNEYLDFLSNYKFDSSEVDVSCNNGDLIIRIKGAWKRTIMWEVPLLAVISELYYAMTGEAIDPTWERRITDKADKLETAGCKWIEFGTRRRYSYEVQRKVVETMKNRIGFQGTSNCYLAYLYGIPVKGTMSHQYIMALAGMYGASVANGAALSFWRMFYKNKLMIFLPDTFTTPNFLKFFDPCNAREWQGLRQDSGDPSDWMDNYIIPHYKKMGVSLKDKTTIFSDSLTTDKYIALHNKYKNITNVMGGIGTHLSNDVGVKPLSIVIKLSSVNGNNVIKLSDDTGKNTGNSELVWKVKKELGLE